MTEEIERSFSVVRMSPIADCEIILDGGDLEGKTEEQIIEFVRECAQNSDNWRTIESEENDVYEVEED